MSGIVHAPQNGDFMSATPFLSVIVPVYNAEAYLRGCVDSILAQTFDDYEVILVDDGSTDRCPAICDEYAAQNPRVRVLHQPNGGQSAAREAGFHASSGKYIAFADSDDHVDPHMYSDMSALAEKYHADIVHCDFTAVMPGKEKVCAVPYPAGLYDKQKLMELVYPTMIYSGTFYTFSAAPNLWNKLFRRELLGKHLFQVPHEIRNGEDFPVTFSCMLDADSIYFTDKAYYYYCSRPSSMCHTVNLEELRSHYTLFATIHDIFPAEKYPFLQRQLSYFIVYQTLLYALPVMQELSDRTEKHDLYRELTGNRHIHAAMHSVQPGDITGIRNKLFVYGFRLHLYPLVLLALLKK